MDYDTLTSNVKLLPDNPWREFIENCKTGDNFFRSSEYDDLLSELDAGYSAMDDAEALRAEVRELKADRDSWEQQASDRVSDWHDEHKRAERLAEALRDSAQHLRDHASDEFQGAFDDTSEAARLNRLNLLADRIEALAAQPGETDE